MIELVWITAPGWGKAEETQRKSLFCGGTAVFDRAAIPKEAKVDPNGFQRHPKLTNTITTRPERLELQVGDRGEPTALNTIIVGNLLRERGHTAH